MTADGIRLLLVDDQELFRRGMHMVLDAEPGIEVVGEAGDGRAAIDSARTALAPIPADILAAVAGAAGPPTLDALCTALTRQPYALLHIVAHGRYKTGDGEPILFLATSTGDVAPIAGTWGQVTRWAAPAAMGRLQPGHRYSLTERPDGIDCTTQVPSRLGSLRANDVPRGHAGRRCLLGRRAMAPIVDGRLRGCV